MKSTKKTISGKISDCLTHAPILIFHAFYVMFLTTVFFMMLIFLLIHCSLESAIHIFEKLHGIALNTEVSIWFAILISIGFIQDLYTKISILTRRDLEENHITSKTCRQWATGIGYLAGAASTLWVFSQI